MDHGGVQGFLSQSNDRRAKRSSWFRVEVEQSSPLRYSLEAFKIGSRQEKKKRPILRFRLNCMFVKIHPNISNYCLIWKHLI